MFTYLKVKNFALIDDIEIEFNKGFTAFVGETGAGKSLLIDAINMLSGARSSATFVKYGQEFAEIHGMFSLNSTHKIWQILAELEIAQDDAEELLIYRKIMKDGRSICKIQNVVVPAQTLKRVMSLLVDVHNQHENNYLLNAKNHLKLLDVFSSSEQIELAQNYAAAFLYYRELLQQQQELLALSQGEQDIDFLQKKLAQLTNQMLLTTEQISEVEQQYQSLKTLSQNFDKMQQVTSLYDNHNVLEHVFTINKTMYDEALQARVETAYYELEDIYNEVVTQQEQLLTQKQEQQDLESQLATIYSLQKEFGEDLLLAQQQLEEQIESLHNIDFDLQQLAHKVDEQKQLVQDLAEQLSSQRQLVAATLAKNIKAQLHDLYMEQVDFIVDFQTQEAGIDGIDKIEFLICTNIGSQALPLAKIASGGELSRIMLAIKLIFSQKQTLSTIIFDEIDTGVSGKVAYAIAQKMRAYSQKQQVFAITHLPQVLAASEHQLYIQKQVQDQQTNITTEYLVVTRHIDEVAKMLSGTDVNASAQDAAQTLIQSFE